MANKKLAHLIKCKIEPNHIDIYNHLNYVYYPFYFEKCRIALQNKIGFPDSIFVKKGIGFIVYKAEYEYKKQIFKEQEIEIYSKFLPYKKGARFFIEYEIYSREEKVAVAKTEHTFMNLKLNKPIKPPCEFIDKLKKSEN